MEDKLSSFEYIWVFNGFKSRFPSGLFRCYDDAVFWISKNKLTGVLTHYPLNIGAFDYAIQLNLFQPKENEQIDSEFIGRFTCGGFDHYHFEEGELV